MKSVFAPHLQRTVKLGRRQPTSFARRRTLSSFFLRAALPPPPSSTNYRAKADGVLRDIYGNDELGDCVVAAGYHVEGEATANSSTAYHATLAQIIKDYGAIGGYVPGDPSTDNGCDEETALQYWCKNGFANGVQLLGYIPIDPSSEVEIKQAIYLFENVFYGVGLPDAWISPFPAGDGFVWDDTGGNANPQNGHAFVGIDYDETGVVIDTWGIEGHVTPRATAKYAANYQGGQLFTLLTPSLIAKGMLRAPNGLDWPTLIADFNSMGGSVPVPPAPSPVPGPSSSVTLHQAQAWATAGVKKAKGLSSTKQRGISNLVAIELAKNWPT